MWIQFQFQFSVVKYWGDVDSVSVSVFCSKILGLCGSVMVDPLICFLFQPVLHDWCNKGCGMCYLVCGMMRIKEPLLLIRMSSSRFPLLLSEWFLWFFEGSVLVLFFTLSC